MTSSPNSSASPAAAERSESVTLRSGDGSTEAESAPSANLAFSSLRHHGVEYLHRGRVVDPYPQDGTTAGNAWVNSFRPQVARSHVVLTAAANPTAPDDHGPPIHGAMPVLMRWALVRQSRGRGASLELCPAAAAVPVPARVARGDDGRGRRVDDRRDAGADRRVEHSVSFGHPWRLTLDADMGLPPNAPGAPTGVAESATERRPGLSEVDKGFGSLAVPARVQTAAGELAVTVEFLEGQPHGQVGGAGGGELICFEPMTAAPSAPVSGERLALVSPREQYQAAFRISIASADVTVPCEVGRV